jgi:hypothetical protein
VPDLFVDDGHLLVRVRVQEVDAAGIDPLLRGASQLERHAQ